MATKIIEVIGQGEYPTIETTNATPADLYEVLANPYAATMVQVHVFARNIDTGATRVWEMTYGMSRVAEEGVAVFEFQTVTRPQPPAGPLAACVAAIQANGDNWRVRVTGIAATNIAWGMTYIGDRFIVVPE